MSVSTSLSTALASSASEAIAEVNFTTSKGKHLHGSDVTSVINDLCASVRCARDTLPPVITHLYDRARRCPDAWFDRQEVVDAFDLLRAA